ncbi:hypothetical protein MKW94_007959 [Papaver nudicaule]|uniref:Cytosine-specific methyltransferase n=1 Tax=Papaver nudicaule TaxID=74823 RepID=A0AA41S2C2_PAPNU|nr:hypothetical protein [Papaver nudicaule]
MERRRSARVPKPVLKPEAVKMAEEAALNDAKKRKTRGKRKVDEGSTSSAAEASTSDQANKKAKRAPKKKKEQVIVPKPVLETDKCKLSGEQIPEEEAKAKWPERYFQEARKKMEQTEVLPATSHYSAAEVDGVTYNLSDNALVKNDDEDELPYICKILEFFKTSEGHVYFKGQWFYRACDTVIGTGPNQSGLIDERRVFYSEVKDDNPLDCLVGKPKISMIASNMDVATKNSTIAKIGKSEFYCDMLYQLPYNSFVGIPPENINEARDGSDIATGGSKDSCSLGQSVKSELSLLDLYAGCGAMSTGLCLGAKVGGVNLVTRWALDLNESACQSLALNHPETKVTNDCGDNFLSLLREWERLCQQFNLVGTSKEINKDESSESEDCEEVLPGEFEVGEIIGISFGNPADLEKVKKSTGKGGKKVTIPKGTELYFKVHWKGFDASEDSWEPLSNLSNCEEKIKKFVSAGYKSNLLPLPGDVDVICGGPPCQGISGHNHFRDADNPLADEKNLQMVVYTEIVKFLKPQYVLMENVVDLLKFSSGFLARHAVSRLISMDYQVRVGIMAAGSFGVAQFRQRVFVWGAQIGKVLPPYPLPTHEADVRGGVPNQFDECLVAHDDIAKHKLKKALNLRDALSDLPKVHNDELRDQMPYGPKPKTEFQKFIRLNKEGKGQTAMLYNHQPLKLNEDDYQRVCRVPKKKGACYRDLDGIIEDENGKWVLDPKIKRPLLDSGKPLVPDYALRFRKGSSKKPFGRLWWDETVSTVVTRAEPHNQVMTHPVQDRVLTVRENARLQGFPDYYKLCGDVRETYTQVGNAVAVPVGKALGYALALSVIGLCDGNPLVKLPANFTFTTTPLPPPVVELDQ